MAVLVIWIPDYNEMSSNVVEPSQYLAGQKRVHNQLCLTFIRKRSFSFFLSILGMAGPRFLSHTAREKASDHIKQPIKRLRFPSKKSLSSLGFHTLKLLSGCCHFFSVWGCHDERYSLVGRKFVHYLSHGMRDVTPGVRERLNVCVQRYGKYPPRGARCAYTNEMSAENLISPGYYHKRTLISVVPLGCVSAVNVFMCFCSTSRICNR
jgi:hypothetical protein